jgi:oligoendopeptidase F
MARVSRPPTRRGSASRAIARHLHAAERFPPGDPRRSARERAAARLVAEDIDLADSPDLRPWRDDLRQWATFVDYLLDDATEAALSESGHAVIATAMATLDDLDAAPPTSLDAAEQGVHLLDSPDPVRRGTADVLISTITDRRAPVMCGVLQSLTAAHAADDAARGITNWRLRFALSQQTSADTLDHLLAVVAERTDTARAWYAHRVSIVGDRYADRRVLPPIATVTLQQDATLVADALAADLPQLRVDAARAAARITQGATNEVVFEADGRLSATVDHRPTARGRLMVAHELGHAVHALRATSDRPPNALVGETVGCTSALLAGLHLARQGGADQAAAALAVGDMVVEELFLSALVCRFEDEIQRRVRSGHTLTVELLDDTWLQLHRQLFGEVIMVPPTIASHWSRLPSLAVHPGHAISYVWATVLALAVQASLAGDPARSTSLVEAIDHGAMPADRLPELLGFSGSTWIDAGLASLDAVLGRLRHC